MPSEQLSLPVGYGPMPSGEQARELAALVVGFWAAGERMVDVGGKLVSANVWFHFGDDGTAALTVRYRDQDRANAAEGRWSLAEGELLIAEFGKTVIGAPLKMIDGAEVIQWAGEVLSRMPQDLATDEQGRDAIDRGAVDPLGQPFLSGEARPTAS